MQSTGEQQDKTTYTMVKKVSNQKGRITKNGHARLNAFPGGDYGRTRA